MEGPYGSFIDKKRVYAIGLSNGGIFLSTLAIYYSTTWAAVCNYMGGYGIWWCECNIIDTCFFFFSVFFKSSMSSYVDDLNPDPSEARRKIPLLIVVGSNDPMLSYCKTARQEFSQAGHYVKFGYTRSSLLPHSSYWQRFFFSHTHTHTHTHYTVHKELIPGVGHQYIPEKEDMIWDFFSQHSLQDSPHWLCHLLVSFRVDAALVWMVASESLLTTLQEIDTDRERERERFVPPWVCFSSRSSPD